MSYYNKETLEIENVLIEPIPEDFTTRLMNWIIWGNPKGHVTDYQHD